MKHAKESMLSDPIPLHREFFVEENVEKQMEQQQYLLPE
jgi:hypothetical protein